MQGHGLQPLFCRVGTKKTLVDKILPLIPDHKLYVETMVGGGAIFWNKSSAEKSIINDLDKDLIKSYRILKKADKEAVLSYIPVSDTESVETRVKKIQAIKDHFVSSNLNCPVLKYEIGTSDGNIITDAKIQISGNLIIADMTKNFEGV